MNHFLMYVAFAVLMQSLLPGTQAQVSDWKLRKEQQGIAVYTRSVEGSSLAEFKGVATVDASIEQLVHTLQDVARFKAWLPVCARAELLKLDGAEQYHYLETDAPFPFSNRDSYYRFTYLPQGKHVRVEFEALPHHLPPKQGLVRIPFAKGYWLLEHLQPNQTRVTYRALADPGGSIPAWLANAAVVDMPFATLENLREYLK